MASSKIRLLAACCYLLAVGLLLAAIAIAWQRQMPVAQAAQVEILAPDVEIHLGDQNDLVAPWKPLYHNQNPSTVWQGDFYMNDPGSTDWLLRVDVLQPNDRANFFRINGHTLQPAVLPGRDFDWSSAWTRFTISVPVATLRPGHNVLTFEIGQWMPSMQYHDNFWEDVQIRNILLIRK
jgi:hypothetical protein